MLRAWLGRVCNTSVAVALMGVCLGTLISWLAVMEVQRDTADYKKMMAAKSKQNQNIEELRPRPTETVAAGINLKREGP